MKIDTKLRDFSEPQNQDIHGLVFPADIRETDPIGARLRKVGESEFRPQRVWRLSPFGIELVTPEVPAVDTGDMVEVEVSVGRTIARFEGVAVKPKLSRSERRILGIRFTDRKSSSLTDGDRRTGSRWVCNTQYDPIGIAPNPAQFNDFIYFKIRDISKSGIRAITSLRNKFIIPGMELNLQISFPMTSHVAIPARVTRLGITAEGGKDYLDVGLKFNELSRRQREVIGQYLVQFSNAESLKAIRNDGFFPLSLTKGIDYQFIKSEEDFRRVLELRLRANREAGKVPERYTAEDMADIFDTRSRIIVGKYRNEVVGTIRLTFFEANERLEHENYLTFPGDFPKSHQILECSRAATSPEFRGSDLWTTLMQHIAIVALLAKREWVLISTTPDLVPMYKKIGFKDTGQTYEHELYPGQTQVVLLINVPEAVMGVNVGPIYWNVIWRGVARYLHESGKLNPSTKARIYSLFGPLSAWLRYVSRNPRSRKRSSDKST